jgi:hypothetical protein
MKSITETNCTAVCWEITRKHVGQNNSKDVITAAVYGSKAKRNINTYRGIVVGSMRSVSRQQIKSLPLYTWRKYPRRDRLTGGLCGPQRGLGRFRNETNAMSGLTVTKFLTIIALWHYSIHKSSITNFSLYGQLTCCHQPETLAQFNYKVSGTI